MGMGTIAMRLLNNIFLTETLKSGISTAKITNYIQTTFYSTILNYGESTYFCTQKINCADMKKVS